jgi:subtilisin family serine protease
VIVRFKPSTGNRVSPAAAFGLISQHPATKIPFLAVNGTSRHSGTTEIFTITDGKTVAQKIQQLKQLETVEFVEPDYQVQLFNTPSDPGIGQQWHHARISSSAGWGIATGSKAVKVCVIDSGVRIDHPDIAANVIKGWNVIPARVGGRYPTPGDSVWRNYNDTLGHGTHVAGLVGGVGDNARGISGVAWKAGLLPCRFISDVGSGYVADAITCIRLCRAEGATVYVNSWGGVTHSAALEAEIRDVDAAKGLFVVAAGNDYGVNLDASTKQSPTYPASYKNSNVVTVGSTTRTESLSDFSNVGVNSVHIAAPGSSVLSTTHDGGYGLLSGTSMSTPIVAGAAALLQSFALSRGVQLGPQQVKQILMSGVDTLPSLNGLVANGGRLNVARALQILRDMLPSSPPSAPSAPKPSPRPSPLPQLPTPSPIPNLPCTDPTPSPTIPQCGTSALRGKSANQSSVAAGRVAEYAVNADCRMLPNTYPTACASTHPSGSNPWWTASLGSSMPVAAVSLTTRADCCWWSIGGAQVLVGNTSWVGPSSRSAFRLCGKVPSDGIPRGQRLTLSCPNAYPARYVAVYLPKLKTSLTLCEVDVALDNSKVNAENKRQSTTEQPNANGAKTEPAEEVFDRKRNRFLLL